MSGLINPFGFGPAVVDGTQGSTNAGILAGVMFTWNGSSVSIVGQKNVASVTRLVSGIYRVSFTSALSNANYGVLATARLADGSGTSRIKPQPSRNSTSGRNAYSTTEVDIFMGDGFGTGALDPAYMAVVVFDPANVGSDYLAACMVTVSGTTPTVQTQTNVSSAPRQATGCYRPTFSSALGNSDYSPFGTTRAAAFTNNANLEFGRGRNTTGTRNQQTTGLIDLSTGFLPFSGTFEPSQFSMLLRNSDVAPRGTVASVRFSYISSTISIIRSWNVSGVTRGSTGEFRISFTTPISDADYMAFAGGKWSDSTQDDAPMIHMNANTGSSRGNHTINEVDIVIGSYVSLFDADYVDVWVLKPWLM